MVKGAKRARASPRELQSLSPVANPYSLALPIPATPVFGRVFDQCRICYGQYGAYQEKSDEGSRTRYKGARGAEHRYRSSDRSDI